MKLNKGGREQLQNRIRKLINGAEVMSEKEVNQLTALLDGGGFDITKHLPVSDRQAVK